jgi:hypothetical protein
MDRWMNKQKDRQTNEQIELTDIKTDTQTPHHIKTDNNFLYLHFPIRNASSVCALFANWNKMKHVTLFHSVLFSICNEYSIKRSNELMTQRGYNIIFYNKVTYNMYTFWVRVILLLISISIKHTSYYGRGVWYQLFYKKLPTVYSLTKQAI